MDLPEFKKGRRLDIGDDLWVVLGADARQLDFDPIVSDRADDRFADAESIHPGADDIDRLGELFLHVSRIARRHLGIDFEGDRDAAVQVQPELEPALGPPQQLVHQDVVAAGDVVQRAFDPNVRIILCQVELALGRYLLCLLYTSRCV